MKMFEIAIGLTVFGVLYVAVIEILEKCKHRDAHTEQEARLRRQVAPSRQPPDSKQDHVQRG
jgi:hypothetical protein